MRDIYDAIRIGFSDFEDLRPKPHAPMSEKEKDEILASLSELKSNGTISRQEKEKLELYLKFLLKRNESLSQDKIRILINLDEIQKAKEELIKDGRYYPIENLIGVISRDPWFHYISDPVQFMDSGRYGRYTRVVYAGGTGIAIAIKFSNTNKFLLNLMYRHAIRGYSMEVPGTITRDGESIKDSLVRCLKIETGLDQNRVSRIIYLGNYISDRGLMGETVPLLYIEIDGDNNSKHLIRDEGLQDQILLSFAEWKNYLIAGSIIFNKIEYTCNDGYSRSALFLMEQKGIEKI